VPVTSKAQQSESYQEYLSKSGSDNSTYYDVKIKAAQLLLDNIDNTFVTPVFNGSTSLRDAAGQLIENTVKSVRRKQEVNDEYIENLYSDVTSLYRLDQLGADGISQNGKADLGKLPGTAVALLSALVTAWVLIIAYVIYDKVKKHRKSS
jgi:multiple sugar transport system substrate-binding protein